MDAQTLGALANIVKEAIAEAVAPLQDRIKELEGRPVHSAYDDSEVRSDVKRLRDWIGPSDVAGTIHERIEYLAKSVPDAYDDAGLVARVAKQLEDFRSELPKAYDDTALREWLGEKLKAAPAAYDDSEAQATMAQVVETQRVGAEAIAAFGERIKSLEARPTARDGAPGADGRDALQLEVLPAVDEQKSYTRGTYAKHVGGLWRAFEQTSGMRGWECIVDGVKELQVDMVDKRLSVKAVMSSGALTEMVKELPIQIYRGVFKSDDPYHQGDTVTWAGSLWHCNVTGTKALPGDGSTDWTLAVKKGRDGREVVSVPRAERPVKV